MQNGEKWALFQKNTRAACAKSRKRCLSNKDTPAVPGRKRQTETQRGKKNRKKLYYYEICTIICGETGRSWYFFDAQARENLVKTERPHLSVCAGGNWVYPVRGHTAAGKRLLPVWRGQTPAQFQSMSQLYFHGDSIRIRLFYRRKTVR